MVVAIYELVSAYHAPLISPTGGPAYELPLVYVGITLLLMAAGPGKLSVDGQLFTAD